MPAGGFVLGGLGFVLLTRVQPTSPLVLLLIGAGVLSAGLVAVMTLVTEMAMGAMDPARAGSAAAVLETGSEFGGVETMPLVGP